MSKRSKALLISIALIWVCTPTLAYAYIDPNAGGLLFQLGAPLIALVTTGLLLAKERFLRAVAACVNFLRRVSGWDRQ